MQLGLSSGTTGTLASTIDTLTKEVLSSDYERVYTTLYRPDTTTTTLP